MNIFTGVTMARVRRAGRKQVLRALVREYYRVIDFDPRVFSDHQWIQNRRGYHPVPGTDASEKMVEYANRTHAIDEVLRDFETLNIQTKDLPEKYIAELDVIHPFPVLHFCNDIRQGFENIYNMLRPGGTFYMMSIFS
ncbi:PREDICTED: uncharacterized protein LOC105148283 [Acromyrmex echinatior]|uniref:uncharacterized protein LOC105148283 n=1 Tax=Acromyrmex echinatior TaxID=103372 RepID=UPI000580E27F|nr:PREDICTED: uncharacterized protein LOC105148283 [Acromyrmex echinatior]XP_011058226.1 PREDICTED: uncharacterized protein LOC105148283 [Acromyrmex echinatior]